MLVCNSSCRHVCVRESPSPTASHLLARHPSSHPTHMAACRWAPLEFMSRPEESDADMEEDEEAQELSGSHQAVTV